MKRNKRTTFSTLRVLVAAGLLILALTGIGLLMGCGQTALDEPDVIDEPEVIPEIAFGDVTSRIVITEQTKNTYLFYMAAPILTSWKDNSRGINVGQTLQGSFLGEDVTVSMSQEQGVFTFTGELDDGQFTAIYTPSTKTFDYTQDVLVSVPPMSDGTQKTRLFVRTVFTGVELDANNHFHAEYAVYFAQIIDKDNNGSFEHSEFHASEDVEFFSGIDASTGHKVAGFALKQGGKSDNTDPATPYTDAEITFTWYQDKMDAFVNAYLTNPGSLEDRTVYCAASVFDYEADTEPSLENAWPANEPLDTIDAAVPWDIIRN